jgi:hypothetical protein
LLRFICLGTDVWLLRDDKLRHWADYKLMADLPAQHSAGLATSETNDA